jgi:uncharacterized lipoprotein YmbA
LLLSACSVVPPPQGDATRFFLLTAPKNSVLPEKAAQGGVRLGLRSIEMADYLRTRAIVVRRAENELSLDDYNRWAEPLDSGIARLLRANLRATPGVSRVFSQPFPLESDRDFDVAVTVLRCEGSPSGSGRGASHFSAFVEVFSAGINPKLVARFDYVAPDQVWDGRDYGQLAADLSESVNGLAGEIARSIQQQPKP